MDFNTALNDWLNGVRKLVRKHYQDSYPNLPVPTLDTDEGGKFIRIVEDNGSQKSAFAFVAKVDGQTKALGKVKQGDVLKTASWKAPARHARGNIFDDSKGLKHVGPRGPAYL
tara:strand:+ start:9253 stop:9591 length:339 start_codon:yes stop_codon:yes gene_type:complete